MNTELRATPVTWDKSSYSTATGNCVEYAPMSDNVLVRDSKSPEVGSIDLSSAAWAGLLNASRDDPAA